MKRSSPVLFALAALFAPLLPAGANYWLGVIIDDLDAIAERNETNNATYIPIQVVN